VEQAFTDQLSQTKTRSYYKIPKNVEASLYKFLSNQNFCVCVCTLHPRFLHHWLC